MITSSASSNRLDYCLKEVCQAPRSYPSFDPPYPSPLALAKVLHTIVLPPPSNEDSHKCQTNRDEPDEGKCSVRLGPGGQNASENRLSKIVTQQNSKVLSQGLVL